MGDLGYIMGQTAALEEVHSLSLNQEALLAHDLIEQASAARPQSPR